jgi:hypothetical protein
MITDNWFQTGDTPLLINNGSAVFKNILLREVQ